MKETYQVKGEVETREAAARLAQRLEPGDIVCLYGELGAGKTAFCQGALKALGVKEQVTSPTFTIVHEYQGQIPVYHFDVYRVHGPDDMFEIGYEEYFFGKGVCFIEWAELIEELLPEHCIRVWMSYAEDDEEGRVIEIEYPGN